MLFFLTAITVVAFDQLSKYWIRANILDGHSISREGVAWFIRIHNSAGELSWILITNTILIAFVIFSYYYFASGKRLPSVALGLILGAFVGNTIDRLWLGLPPKN